MESASPGPNKGYQKQVKKDATPPPKPKIHPSTDYSSPTAKRWPRLNEAIEHGKTQVVQELLDEGINVNLHRDGVTPLMIAASHGQTAVAGIILQAGANINEKTDDGWTALHKAAWDQETTGIVEYLLESGIDVEAKDKAGKTALALAEEKGRREIAKVIKKHQAQLRADGQEWEAFLRSPEGKPFLQQRQYESLTRYSRFWWVPAAALAILGALLGLLFGKALLTGVVGAVIGLAAGGTVPLRERMLKKHLDEAGPLPELDIHILRLKRKTGEPLFPPRESKPAVAEEEPATEPVDPMIMPDIAVADAAEPVKVRAVSVTHAEPVKKATRGRVKIAAFAGAALVLALLAGAAVYQRDSLAKWYYAKKIEKSGIEFSGQGFLQAVIANNEQAVELFVKAGADTGVRDGGGRTAIMIAADKGYEGLLTRLIALDPSLLNAVDRTGNTALMAASRRGSQPVVRALVEKGADVNFTVPAQEGPATALQAVLGAADFREEQRKTADYLIQHGADVKARNSSGRSALLLAVDQGREDIVRMLAEKGADVDAADLKGGFPLMTAACRGNTGILALLADKGANVRAASPDGRTPLMCAAERGHVDAARLLLEKGADANARTPQGRTALNDASKIGNIELVKLLLERGADPGSGYLPDSFNTLKGRVVRVNTRKSALGNVLNSIARTASRDGYTVNAVVMMKQKKSVKAKGPWNSVLKDLASRNNLFLIVKDKNVFVIPAVNVKAR